MGIIFRSAAVILMTLMFAALAISLYGTGLVHPAWGFVLSLAFILIIGSFIAADLPK